MMEHSDLCLCLGNKSVRTSKDMPKASVVRFGEGELVDRMLLKVILMCPAPVKTQ